MISSLASLLEVRGLLISFVVTIEEGGKVHILAGHKNSEQNSLPSTTNCILFGWKDLWQRSFIAICDVITYYDSLIL